MLESSLVVVISAGQSRNPEKRDLERQVAERAAQLPGVRVLTIPHLYDLTPNGDSFSALRKIHGDVVLLSWLYDRAAHWVLDRNGVRGQVGHIELRLESDEDQDESSEEVSQDDRVIDSQPRPDRRIYCLDFRASQKAEEFADEIGRILRELREDNELPEANDGPEFASARPGLSGTPLTLEALQRFEQPTNDTYLGAPAALQPPADESELATLFGASSVASIDEHPNRRWYPVIDFSRCTNCMECIDFCLFGVYGVDSLETIVVEQADNCRKGCPACSRVCPQNAIIFPQHKTPAIAGAPVDTGGLKIDLSKLFGAPETDEDPATVAARERDEQLILAGREAVGTPVSIRERLSQKPAGQADDLDSLIDELDSLDL